MTGTGKTTHEHALAKELKVTMLTWDDFDEISISPVDYVDWYNRGQNYNEWNYQILAEVLKSLKEKQSILHSISKQTLQPTEYIIFDAPLGRLHQQTAKYIDTCVHFSVPLDILLCRRLLRDFKNENKTKEEILTELEYYLSDSRPLF